MNDKADVCIASQLVRCPSDSGPACGHPTPLPTALGPYLAVTGQSDAGILPGSSYLLLFEIFSVSIYQFREKGFTSSFYAAIAYYHIDLFMASVLRPI